MIKRTVILSASQLEEAISECCPQVLWIQVSLVLVRAVVLPRGYEMCGDASAPALIRFVAGDGIGLSGDNVLRDLYICAPSANRAVFLSGREVNRGTLTLANLKVNGQVGLITGPETRTLRIEADNIDVVAANTLAFPMVADKETKIIQGALSVCNGNDDPRSIVSAQLTKIGIGRHGLPVFGSGILVSGCGERSGVVRLDILTTGAVYSRGALSAVSMSVMSGGMPPVISGGICLCKGSVGWELIHTAEVVTYGVNDMVLANYGMVKHWTCTHSLISQGPGSAALLNAGVIGCFTALGDITTHGVASPGFYQPGGSAASLRFGPVTTFGDGASGIWVEGEVGELEVEGDVVTHRGAAMVSDRGLPQGPIAALAVGRDARVRRLRVHGKIETRGNGVNSFLVRGGTITELKVDSGIIALGEQSNAVVILMGGKTPLTNIRAKAVSGRTLIAEPGTVTDATGFGEFSGGF